MLVFLVYSKYLSHVGCMDWFQDWFLFWWPFPFPWLLSSESSHLLNLGIISCAVVCLSQSPYLCLALHVFLGHSQFPAVLKACEPSHTDFSAGREVQVYLDSSACGEMPSSDHSPASLQGVLMPCQGLGGFVWSHCRILSAIAVCSVLFCFYFYFRILPFWFYDIKIQKKKKKRFTLKKCQDERLERFTSWRAGESRFQVANPQCKRLRGCEMFSRCNQKHRVALSVTLYSEIEG